MIASKAEIVELVISVLLLSLSAMLLNLNVESDLVNTMYFKTIFFHPLFSVISLLSEFYICIILSIAFFVYYRGRGKGGASLFGLILALAITYLAKEAISRPRPELFYPSHDSFPSGHLSGITSTFRPFINSRLKALLFTSLIVLVGISRIGLGAHYPSDILAGLSIGLLSSLSVRILMRLK